MGWVVAPAGCLLFLCMPLSWTRCIHDAVQSAVPVLRARVAHTDPWLPSLRKPRSVAPEALKPIRIRAWYLRAESALLSLEQTVQLEAAVGEATLQISRALAVHPVPGRLLLSRDLNRYCRSVWRDPASPNYNKCGFADIAYHSERCLEVTIPDEHLEGYAVWPEYGDAPSEVMKRDGAGVTEADFILYVKVASTEKCHIEVTLHELLHALGFSRSLFEKWKDCTTAPAVGVNCSSRTRVTNTDEGGQVRIFTPAVMQKMKEHLGGGEIGAPLENQDKSGLTSSHWEARVLQGSIMTASLPDARLTQLDQITLAAFADTGWYWVNDSAGTKLTWGQGEGVDFGLTSTCRGNSSKYFCTGSGSGCHYLHLHKGHCSTDPFMDGCRMYKPVDNGSECWVSGNSVHTARENRFGEIYHSDSRCFFSTLAKEDLLLLGSLPMSETFQGCCYLHRCMGRDQYEVKVAGSPWLSCPVGMSIQVPGYYGRLLCPTGLFCQNTTRSTDSQLNEGVTSPSPTMIDSMSTPNGTATQRTMHFKLQGQLEASKAHQRISETELSRLANLAVKALANFSGVTSCHFEGLVLDTRLEFTVELWQPNTCPDSLDEVTLHRLQSSLHSAQIMVDFNGTDFALIPVRLTNNAHLSADPGHLTILILGLGLGAVVLLTAGAIIHRKHRTPTRVQDVWRAPD
ncbi:ciliated left-right organizer metallopeptidase-like [Ambystoma mexicanum]|uniref:ciliated left-right organizer metallopeptidase-like n=1 Tax=Ambystoma mexicanum TaxID=8296 RepID=UPI0037E81E02